MLSTMLARPVDYTVTDLQMILSKILARPVAYIGVTLDSWAETDRIPNSKRCNDVRIDSA